MDRFAEICRLPRGAGEFKDVHPGSRAVDGVALVADLGKLGVSNEILDKPGKLDPAEWEIVRRHPGWGAEILSRMAAFSDLAKIAREHHERPDGRGYPQPLGGDAIDLETRIVTTADVFDALTADRPYRKAMSAGEALGAGGVGEVEVADVADVLDVAEEEGDDSAFEVEQMEGTVLDEVGERQIAGEGFASEAADDNLFVGGGHGFRLSET